MKKSILILILLSSYSASADLLMLGIGKPKLDVIFCFNPGRQSHLLHVYLLKKDAVFNHMASWPQAKGGTGEYILDKKQVAYFTPGSKPAYSRNPQGKFAAKMKLLNDGHMSEVTFEETSPWDDTSGRPGTTYFIGKDKSGQRYCLGR
jgi:hypothetical protein